MQSVHNPDCATSDVSEGAFLMRWQLIRRIGPERVAHMKGIDCLGGAVASLAELAGNAFADDPVPSLQGVPR